MKYEYLASTGDKYKIVPFNGDIELRKEHIEVLQGKVTYVDKKTLMIETDLFYEVGQFVSTGGYYIGKNRLDVFELSITDYPVLDKAEIISRKEIER